MVNTKQTRQMCNIVLSYNMVITVIFFMAVCWHSVDSTEIPIITRDTYDLVRFPKCGGYSSEKFKCDKVMEWSIPTGDTKTCTCQCTRGHLTYRDPYVGYSDSKYKYDSTKRPGCVWHGYSHEGCKNFESVDRVVGSRHQEYRKPIIIDLTKPGSIVLRGKSFVPRLLDNLTITPHVRTPAKNQWEKITDISFHLTLVNKTGNLDLFELQWTPKGSNIYAYQGLVMRLDLRQSNQPQMKNNCTMTKIAGTFTVTKSCKRQTVDGRCCIFPFVYKNILYDDCAITDDMTGSWCAVGLNTNVIEGNHKWRENCAVPTAKTSSQQITPEPNTRQVRRSSVFPKSTASQPYKSSTTPKVQSPADMSGDSDSNKTIIIAIVVSLVVFLVVLLILVIVCYRRRRISDKSVPRETASNEVVADGFASTMEDNDAIHLEETGDNIILDGPDPTYEYPNVYEPLRKRSRDVEHTYQGLVKAPKGESKDQIAGDYFENHNPQHPSNSTYVVPFEPYEQLGERRQDEENTYQGLIENPNQLYYRQNQPPCTSCQLKSSKNLISPKAF